MLLFTVGAPLLAWLPLPVLGGIMVMIAIGLVDRWSGRLLWQWWRGESSADLRSGLLVMAAVCAVTLLERLCRRRGAGRAVVDGDLHLA